MEPGRATPASLGKLATLFLTLGAISFGGPAAHIALMEEEIVRRRQWLSRGRFLDFVGATNLIPGPNSTELAMHVGHSQAGLPGLVVAGAAFILPAASLVTLLAWIYGRVGSVPSARDGLRGLSAVVVAVVLQALWRLGRSAIRSPTLAIFAVLAVAAVVAGLHELIVLFATGVCAAAAAYLERRRLPPGGAGAQGARLIAALGGLGGGAWRLTTSDRWTTLDLASRGMAVAATASIPLWSLFEVFAKIGSVLFGSGYVLIAFLRTDLVQHLGWITERQLLDAVSVGQLTPGPLFTTATFVGYLVAGWGGALVATIGIFLPAFVLVALSGPLIPMLRRSPIAGAALDGVNVASFALMGVVSVQLARAVLVSGSTMALFLAALALLLTRRVPAGWLMAGGALLGWLVA